MRTTQRKGDTATACAIAKFTEMGYDVSIPLTESAAYDLIVDTSEGLKRVQVKYSSGPWVDLRRIHSNAQGYVVKETVPNAYDWLVVYYNNCVWLYRDCPQQHGIKVNNRFENLTDKQIVVEPEPEVIIGFALGGRKVV